MEVAWFGVSDDPGVNDMNHVAVAVEVFSFEPDLGDEPCPLGDAPSRW